MNDVTLRTMIFVPGYMTKFLDKAAAFNVDALVLDLEDSVPDIYKQAARENIKHYLDKAFFRCPVYVRLNSVDSGLFDEDLKWVLHENVSGFMFTKVRDEKEIVSLDQCLTNLEAKFGFTPGKFKMCPLIETSSAVMRAYSIASASPRVIALVFGGEDYLTDLDGLHKEHGTSLLVPRSLIIIAARSAGVEAIDTPYLDVKNSVGFKREVDLARELGFSGTLIIHPSQIDTANEAFTPSKEEIEEAQKIIETIEKSKKNGLGVALLDGSLIGPPMEKRAQNVIKKMRKINDFIQRFGRDDGRARIEKETGC